MQCLIYMQCKNHFRANTLEVHLFTGDNNHTDEWLQLYSTADHKYYFTLPLMYHSQSLQGL